MAYDIALNASVRSNLLALQNTQGAIDTTNTRLNTGKKVNDVIDDAVAYFSAKALNDRAGEFEERKAVIDQSISSVKTALAATNSIDSLLKQLKGILTAAKAATAAERGDLQTQFNTVKNQVDQLVADAAYQGTNLVNNSVTRLDTQFSERSSSRLIVTAQRLSTYQTPVLASQALSNVNVVGGSGAGGALVPAHTTGSTLQIYAGATGIYYVAVVASTLGVPQTLTFLRYVTTTATTAIASLNSSPMQVMSWVSTTLAARFDTTYFASRDTPENKFAAPGISAIKFQTQYNAASGLNIFLASQIFILVDRAITGSFTITTFSTGTLWSAADFDPSTGVASDQFNEAMNFVIEGVSAALRQNNGAAKILGTNVAVLNTRLEFTKAYVNVQKEGSGKLVLADTNEEGANLISLQTRQQLGIQALAFAGQSEQAVLRLFR